MQSGPAARSNSPSGGAADALRARAGAAGAISAPDAIGAGIGLWRRLRGGFNGGRLVSKPAKPRQRRAQIMAMHDHVDHAVVFQIFAR